MGFVDLPVPDFTPVVRLTLELSANEAKLLAKILDPTKISDSQKKAVAEAIHQYISQYDV